MMHTLKVTFRCFNQLYICILLWLYHLYVKQDISSNPDGISW